MISKDAVVASEGSAMMGWADAVDGVVSPANSTKTVGNHRVMELAFAWVPNVVS